MVGWTIAGYAGSHLCATASETSQVVVATCEDSYKDETVLIKIEIGNVCDVRCFVDCDGIVSVLVGGRSSC